MVRKLIINVLYTVGTKYAQIIKVILIVYELFTVGHVLLSVNGSAVSGRTTEDGRDVFNVIEAKVCFTHMECEKYKLNISKQSTTLTSRRTIH